MNSFENIYKLGDHLTVDMVEQGLLLLVNKPLHWTSFDVVNKLRFKFRHGFGLKKIKVGHAGTLDPLADGLLLVCVGKYTKGIDELARSGKSYFAKIKLGATTATYDSEAIEENVTPLDGITADSVLQVLPNFKGHIMQVPPIYSAIKIEGKAAYNLARRGKDIVMEARPVEISVLDVVEIDLPFVTLDIHCSKGTYIRSMAHDIGQALGVGGYLVGLTRTSIGNYDLKDAASVEDLCQAIESNNLLKI